MRNHRKLGPFRECNSLGEIFDRKGRTETVWGKEPFEYCRKYDGEKNTIKHIESGLQVWNGCCDLINRVDKRYVNDMNNMDYSEQRDRVCVYMWTSKKNFTGNDLTVPKEDRSWKDILFKYAKIYQEEVIPDDGSSFPRNSTSSSLNRSMTSSSSSKAGSTGSNNKKDGDNKDGGSSVVGSNNKLFDRESVGSKKNGSSNVGSNKSGVSMKKEYRYFLGEFLCLEPEDLWQRAQELEIPYFKEEGVNCHPALVHLVELMTGKSIRDAVRADMLKDFEIALPIWVPFKSLVQSRDNYGFQHFPYIVNIDMSFYSDIPIQFWNDRLIDACAEGQPNKVHLCLDNGADVNYQDCRGWSPLHCIANILHDRAFISENRKKQCFDLIIKKKANLHARTLRGEKPLALAELRGFDKCADFIRAENLIPIKEVSTKGKNQELPLVKGLRLKELF